MAKNFGNKAYLEKWDGKIAAVMAVVIVVSIALVVWLNKAAQPDCTTHEYVFCGTELVGNEPEGAGHHGAGGGEHAAPAGTTHGTDNHGEHGHDHSHDGDAPGHQ